MIAGMMAIDGRFELWKQCLVSLAGMCDEVVIRLDGPAAEGEEFHNAIYTMCGHKIHSIGFAKNAWNRWNWRESMLREVDKLEPEIVLCPDQDEMFKLSFRDGEGIMDDIEALRASDKQGLMFSYHSPMPTCDGAPALPPDAPYATYPGAPHMKAFKWQPGLSYKDYTGFARVTNYAHPKHHLAANSKIMHYCCWTEAMRKGKDWKW